MSSTLLAKPVVTAAAAALNQELAEFKSVSNKITPETKGVGSQVQIYVNRPSNVWVGSDAVPTGYQQNQEKVVTIRLENYAALHSLGTVEVTNDLINKQEQIMANLRVGIQRQLKRAFFNGLACSCNTYINAQGQGNGTNVWNNSKLAFADLSDAQARVLDSVVGDGTDISVLLPSTARAELARAAATNFWSESTQDNVFKNRLASFDGMDIIGTNVQGNRPTVALPGIATAPSEGDSFITCNATTVAIPAGTLFTIGNIQALDMEGRGILNKDGTPALAVFGTPIDIPAGSTKIPLGKTIFTTTTNTAIKFADSYFSNNGVNSLVTGGNQGVGGGVAFIDRLPTTADTLTQINGGKTMVLVYSSLAFAACTASPGPAATKEEYTETRAGVAIRTTVQGSNQSGKVDYRMEAIAGFSGVYCPGAVVVLF